MEPLKYFDGYYQVRENILWAQDAQELLDVLDALYGRKDLTENSDLETLRQEALRQQEMDWRITIKGE